MGTASVPGKPCCRSRVVVNWLITSGCVTGGGVRGRHPGLARRCGLESTHGDRAVLLGGIVLNFLDRDSHNIALLTGELPLHRGRRTCTSGAAGARNFGLSCGSPARFGPGTGGRLLLTPDLQPGGQCCCLRRGRQRRAIAAQPHGSSLAGSIGPRSRCTSRRGGLSGAAVVVTLGQWAIQAGARRRAEHRSRRGRYQFAPRSHAGVVCRVALTDVAEIPLTVGTQSSGNLPAVRAERTKAPRAGSRAHLSAARAGALLAEADLHPLDDSSNVHHAQLFPPSRRRPAFERRALLGRWVNRRERALLRRWHRLRLGCRLGHCWPR